MEYIYKVSEINRKVKQYLEENIRFRNLIIEGEMSGVTYYKSGHLYFQLKDEYAQVKCVAFSYQKRGIPEDLQEGEKIRIFADVSFYENRGDFQLLVRGIEKQNALGKLFADLEERKKKMKEQGYFLDSHKKALPKYPKAIGVVTAITGAAVQDIIKTIRKRDPRIDIYVCSAKVQGIGAEAEIIEGIEILNKIPEIDFIIAGRGGGSIEDLWAFNTEEVALAFYYSQKPIISAVGHEVDILLSDFTADVRAATPTQAVELSVPELSQYYQVLHLQEKKLVMNMQRLLQEKKQALEFRKREYMLQYFPRSIEDRKHELLQKETYLHTQMETYLAKKKQQYELRLERIISLNPMKILQQGYGVIRKQKRKVLSIQEVSCGEKIDVYLLDGSFSAEIKEKYENEEKD